MDNWIIVGTHFRTVPQSRLSMAQPIKDLSAMKETRFYPWVGKIPWRMEGLPTLVFLPGEFHGQRSLAGYNPWGGLESDMTEQLTYQIYFHINKVSERKL